MKVRKPDFTTAVKAGGQSRREGPSADQESPTRSPRDSWMIYPAYAALLPGKNLVVHVHGKEDRHISGTAMSCHDRIVYTHSPHLLPDQASPTDGTNGRNFVFKELARHQPRRRVSGSA